MAELRIRLLPDPILREKSKKVTIIDKSIKKLVADMLAYVHAAPQIGKSIRVCVIGIEDEDDKTKFTDYVLINPEIVKTKGERILQEGCLSIPGYIGEIKRAESVTVKCRDLSGKEIRIRGKELLAEALEHEIDHLNGILYIDRLESPDKLHRIEDLEKEEEESEDGRGTQKEN